MEIDWWTLALQTINFLVVVWLLSRFLYRPVRRIIDAREASDRAAADDAKSKAEEAERLRVEYEQKLAALDEQMRQREAELHEAMKQESEKTRAAAREEAEGLRAAARADIADAKARAVANLQNDILDLARDLVKTALSDTSADPAMSLQAELVRLDEADLDRMQQDLTKGGELTLVTREESDEEMRAELRRLLTDALGKEPTVVFEAEPSVLGGVRLRLPHGVLDATVSGRLKAAAKAMAEGEDDD